MNYCERMFLWLVLVLGMWAPQNSQAEVKLIVPAGYLPGVPVLARVEVRDASGARDWNLWNAEATLTVDGGGISLSTNRVVLRNGLGTTLLTISGGSNTTLRARVNTQEAARAITNRSSQLTTTASGTLAGSATTWAGIVNVTGTVTVPAGHTLTIQSNTIVLLNGVSTGSAGVGLIVSGTVRSLGTELFPVTITCSNPALNWGQIRHTNAPSSLYQYTFVSKAGRAPAEGHTSTGPAFRLYNSTLDLESSVISDITANGSTIGKVMMADGSTVTLRDCVLTRARTGPEIAGTGLLCTNSYILDMNGPDDCDGIYLHSSTGRPLTLSGCVFASGDDDAVDTLDSNVTIENCIMRDWANPSEDAKGVSIFNGEITLRKCLMVNCFVGMSAKSDGPQTVVHVDHATINGNTVGVSATFKSNASAGNISWYLTNSIVRAPEAVHSDFGPDKFVSVVYCNLSGNWPGVGNITTDPLFVDSAAADYHLQTGSPCIDAGDPGSPADLDGTRADIGFFTAQVATDKVPPAILSLSPAAGSTVTAVSNITVTFSEVVTGVNASDLLINSNPATGVSGSGAGPYLFTCTPPSRGSVTVTWAAGHGIVDEANNPFGAAPWSYVVGAAAQAPVVISEIMYHPISENPLEQFIELHNRSTAPVNLADWKFSNGVEFTFPAATLAGGGYLVVAANLTVFKNKHPGVTNVLGDWDGSLSHSRKKIDLDDAQGKRADSVRYADEGDWAVRQRGLLDRGHRGWNWFAEHDGLSKSAELINPSLSNDNGQNWASSLVPEGTPGRANSVLTNNIAPIIENVIHAPIIPKSTESVVVSAKVSDESDLNVTVTLQYRVDNVAATNFTVIPMHDDGKNGDGAPSDGIYSAVLPPQTTNTIVEFYVRATDGSGKARSWPGPAIAAPDGTGPIGQAANALYQVDDAVYAGTQPLYKVIMAERERAELADIGNNVGGSAQSDAQMNATIITLDGTGVDLKYLTGVRNRGHGTRSAKPNNYRFGFRSDDEWKGVLALNLNAQNTWLQILGSALNLKAGIAGAYSRAVQVRINNSNLAFVGNTATTYGSYAANEAITADWADRHFPDDGQGNIYRAIRDIAPSAFDYRTLAAYPTLFGPENKRSYTHTWFKDSNTTEDDWTDLIGMVRVFGLNGTEPFDREHLSKVINIEQWLRHIAIMNLLGNNETGLNTGYNDDYFMYRGIRDPRFILMYYDQDTILGSGGSLPSNSSLFTATASGANQGSGPAFNRFLHDPVYEPMYYATLKDLLDTTFSATQFDALVDQILGDFVPDATRTGIKTWMTARRAYVLSQLPATLPGKPPVAIVTGVPRSPTPVASAALIVSGAGITAYRFSLNGDAFGPETLIETGISLSGLLNRTNTVRVIGKGTAGVYQADTNATVVSWVVDASWPAIRINEVLAATTNGQPDQIEIYNEGATSAVLTGLRLSDNRDQPGKYVFPAGTLAPGAYLVLDENHLGFALSQDGEGVFLFNSIGAGGALLDSVEFGTQVPGYSLGRIAGGGEWRLTAPTLGRANVLQPLGSLTQIRINEWLALGAVPYPDDFVELYNPESLPVDVGGCSLTDEPVGAPARSPIPPLSFVASRGFLVFSPNAGSGAGKLKFNLAGEQGQLVLLAPDFSQLDYVSYGPQQVGVANGRCPDGAATPKRLDSPSPGAANICPFTPPPPQTVTLIAMTNIWKYNATGTDFGTAWRETNYNDSAWPSGPALIGFETATLPFPILTRFTNPGFPTYYFRTQFSAPAGITPSSLLATFIIDDGAAFYLNGREVFRSNLAANAVYQTFATANLGDGRIQTFTIPVDQLRSGTNTLAVEVHQATAASSDMDLGLMLQAVIITNSAAQAGILINEILAENASIEEPDGSKPDWIELYNPSSAAVDLAGMSLTDEVSVPARWVFPTGSIVAGRDFFQIRCQSDAPASTTNTGFGLKGNGGAVYLFGRPADGGSLQNSVTYGLQAPGWSIGRMPNGGTNWVLNLPTIGMPNIAASLGNARLLKINEWMADPASGEDWFEVFNPNPEPVDISGFRLSDSLSDLLKHSLPPLSFMGNSLHAFQKFTADNTLVAGADHVNFKLSASGEALAMATPGGVLIDGISFGLQITGTSQGRLPDGAGEIVNFPNSASPGAPNYLPLATVAINELLSHSDPPMEDAVEIYNPGLAPVDISGWFLSDSPINLRKFQIPARTIVPAAGYTVLYEYQFNSDLNEGFSFSSAKGDEVFLSQATTNGVLTGYRAHASFGPSEYGVSFGRYRTSLGDHFVAMARRTFGRDIPASVDDFRLGTGLANSAPKIGPVVISEIMYHPPGTNDALEFIELQNITASAIPLFDPLNPAHTWRLRKGIDFEFPEGTLIPAAGFLVVVSFDPVNDSVSRAAFGTAYGSRAAIVGPFRGNLNGSDTIELQKPDAPQTLPGPDFGLVPYVVVERIDYQDAAPWPTAADGTGPSLQRIDALAYGNDPINWQAVLPTPGTAGASSTDADNDGLPNDWETAYGLNPNDPSDAAVDSDGDGMTNLQEYFAGTNPRNPASVFKAVVRFNGAAGLVLEFSAVAGKPYRVEVTEAVGLIPWRTLADLAPAPSDHVAQVPIGAVGLARFFRVIAQP